MRFADRADAGRRLAAVLAELLLGEDAVVLGLPRGGVLVAAEVAAVLQAPLDVLVVRKLGVPFLPELAMGAVAEGGLEQLADDVIVTSAVSSAELDEVTRRERGELELRLRRYRGARPAVSLEGRTALVVDDGVATGSTATVACRAARRRGAARVVCAVPVAPVGWRGRFDGVADESVALVTPASFGSISECYRDFSQASDADVVACLDEQARGLPES